ncbi:MAG TPA: hypothetical protein VK590_15865, partial [Saprospiraceae bacterium]|nr:hypothetical protein [Saprospiraceae bacterium]
MNLLLKFTVLISALCLTIQISFAQDLAQIKLKPTVRFYGSIGLGAQFNNYQNKSLFNTNPFSAYLTGNPTLEILGVTLPFSFTVADRKVNYYTPFNQYGVSPYYKWIKVHLGYRNLQFSEYSLNGITFYGFGVEMNPGIIRIAYMNGRFRNAIELDTTNPGVSSIVSFKRTAQAYKIGIGTNANHIDFVYLHSADDLSSINYQANLLPEENVVIGLQTEFRLGKKITLKLDAAGSVLTRNLYEETIYSNDETFNKHLADIEKLIHFNASTLIRKAGTASLNYNFNIGNVNIKYKRVDPGYASHGAFYTQNDLEDLTLNPSIRLAKNKVFVHFSLGGRRNNLFNTKQTTNIRTIAALNLSIIPNESWNINLGYSNYGTQQQTSNIPINDSVLVSLVNQSYDLQVTKNINNIETNIQYYVNLSNESLLDRNEFTKSFTESQTYIINSGMQKSFTKRKFAY